MIEAGRILEAAGQGDWTRGHVSIRVPDQPDRFYMIASYGLVGSGARTGSPG